MRVSIVGFAPGFSGGQGEGCWKRIEFSFFPKPFCVEFSTVCDPKVPTDIGKNVMCSNNNKHLTVKDMETIHFDLQKRKLKPREKWPFECHI